jgi:hypothetical protein
LALEIPAISAFTRVFDALCAGMSGVLLRQEDEERIFTPVRRA